MSRRFAYAVISSARSGQTLFLDAVRLLDVSGPAFDRIAEILEREARAGER